MLLYQFPMGTNPRRVAIYIAEKGIDVPQYTLDHVNLEHRSAAYLDINPSGRAPTLVTHEGVSITESAAIVEYLEELYPENPMIGIDPLSRAQVRALERIGNDLIVRSQLWLWNVTGAFPHNEPEPSQDFALRLLRHVEELLDLLELAIGDNRFLAGDRPTIADCTVFAMFQTARERFNLPFGTLHPKLDAWYRHFRTRPSADY